MEAVLATARKPLSCWSSIVRIYKSPTVKTSQCVGSMPALRPGRPVDCKPVCGRAYRQVFEIDNSILLVKYALRKLRRIDHKLKNLFATSRCRRSALRQFIARADH